jgi:hypothetical protein
MRRAAAMRQLSGVGQTRDRWLSWRTVPFDCRQVGTADTSTLGVRQRAAIVALEESELIQHEGKPPRRGT